MKRIVEALMLLIPLSGVFAEDGTPKITPDQAILISPGQQAIVSFQRKGNSLVEPRIVEQVDATGFFVEVKCAKNFPRKVVKPATENSILDFMLSQNPKHTILVVKKYFSGTLDYKCEVKATRRFEERNNLPVKTELPMFEQYPEELDVIRLSKFIVEDGAK